MTIPRDEISASAGLPEDQAADLIARLPQSENPTPGSWAPTHLSSSNPAATAEDLRNRLRHDLTPRITATTDGRTVEHFEVPTDLDRWHPNEITDWLSRMEDDDRVSEADLQRARQAVSTALGLD